MDVSGGTQVNQSTEAFTTTSANGIQRDWFVTLEDDGYATQNRSGIMIVFTRIHRMEGWT